MSDKKLKIIDNFKDFMSSRPENIPDALFDKYYSDVKKEMVNLLIDDKTPYQQAYEFVTSMLNSGEKRQQEIKDDTELCFSKNLNASECAKTLIDKYYRITLFNCCADDMNESYYHYKTVSSSLLWNFIRILNDINVKFMFDTSMVGKKNSLNTDNYIFYIDSDKMNKKEVVDEFSNSRMFSKIVKYITDDNTEFISFFIGITYENILNFGYIINEKRYIIGSINYKSDDIRKLAPYIECSDNSITISKLSNRIKTKLYTLNHLKQIFIKLFKNYIDTQVYVTIVNNILTIMIELDDEDIINVNYINKIINDNSYKYKFRVNKMIKDKIYYGINLIDE